MGDLRQRRAGVHEQREGQHDAADRGARDRRAPVVELDHRVEAEEAEGVVEEVRRREREEDQPGPEPHPLGQASSPQDIHPGRLRAGRPHRCHSDVRPANGPLDRGAGGVAGDVPVVRPLSP